MLDDLLTPRGIAAVLLDGNHAEIFHWAGKVIRAAGLFDVLVSPAVVPLVSQQVALNPALFGTGFIAVVDEGAFPNAPQHARETATSKVMRDAGTLDDEAVSVGPFPALDAFGD